MEPKIKTVFVAYQVKVNNDVTGEYLSLKEARHTVKTMPVNDDNNKVMIVKQTVTEQVLDTYEPKVTKVWSAADLSLDIE